MITPTLLGLIGAWIVALPVLLVMRLLPLYLRDHKPEHYRGLWQVLGQSLKSIRHNLIECLLLWLLLLPCIVGVEWLLPRVPQKVTDVSLAVLPLILLVIITVLLVKLRLAEMKHRD